MKEEKIKVVNIKPSLVITDDIIPSPVTVPGRNDVEELAASIKEIGLINPITVRKYNEDNKLELIAGERRWKAFKLLGLDHIPAVLKDVSDAEARAITLTENLQRQDLTLKQEMAQVEMLVNDSGMKTKEIADRTGKTKSWILKRNHLNKLTDKWKDAIDGAESTFKAWTPAHYIIIARFDIETQDELYDYFYARDYDTLMMSTSDLKKFIENDFQMKLSIAPWDIQEPDLAGTGKKACTDCPCTSYNQRNLFDADELPDDIRCMNRKCWQEKKAAFLERDIKETAEVHKNLHISHERFDYDGYKTIDDWSLGYFYDECDPSDKQAIPVYVITDDFIGLKFYKKKPDETSSRSSATKFDAEGNKLPTPLAERREKLQKRRDKKYIMTVKERIENTLEPVWPSGDPVPNIIGVIMAFDSILWGRKETEYGGLRDPKDSEQWANVDIIAKNYVAEPETVIREMLALVTPVWARSLKNLHDWDQIDDGVAFADKACQFLGIDEEAIKADIIIDVPEPKSWASLNKDGTPKKKRSKPKAEKVKEPEEVDPPEAVPDDEPNDKNGYSVDSPAIDEYEAEEVQMHPEETSQLLDDIEDAEYVDIFADDTEAEETA